MDADDDEAAIPVFRIEIGHVRQRIHELPDEIVEAPKRPLQTPQREWLRGPLRPWANDCIEAALGRWGDSWLEAAPVRSEWRSYCEGQHDNSFFVWQWISLGLMTQ